MDGKITCVVLGAGASACYEDGNGRMPTQKDILKHLVWPKIDTSSGKGAPTFLSTYGMTHSYFLAQYLREKYKIPEKQGEPKTDFWQSLFAKGYNLERIYEELEQDQTQEGQEARRHFLAIIRSKLAWVTDDRSRNKICRYHKKLANSLEPGDYIINFNWDTIMDDALLYQCPFWYPLTGYGINLFVSMGEFGPKRYPLESAVVSFHIHGSIALCEPLDKEIQKMELCLALGPKGYNPMHELNMLLGITSQEASIAQKGGRQPKPKRTPTKEELSYLDLGFTLVKGKWFRPIFVPPSRTKPEYKNWYATRLRKLILSKLPFTEQIIIAGYSFPPADFGHLKCFFVPQVLPNELIVKCVNLENNKVEFQDKVKQIFPDWSIDFSVSDFKQFCNLL